MYLGELIEELQAAANALPYADEKGFQYTQDAAEFALRAYLTYRIETHEHMAATPNKQHRKYHTKWAREFQSRLDRIGKVA